jgi:hypothetical protein
MKTLRRVNRGDKPKADDINQFVDAIEEIRRLTVGAGLELHRSSMGTTISIKQAKPQAGYFWAKIAGSTPDGANRWKYTWEEVEKTKAGYTALAWTKIEGGKEGTAENGNYARNLSEVINLESGLLGNGVNTSSLVGTFKVIACPTGNPVLMQSIKLPDNTTEYWFDHQNGIDGNCP